MIKSLLKLASLGSLIFLAACQTDLQVQLPLSDMLSPKGQQLDAVLLVEIPGCVSYEDSRQPSSSLVEAMETVPQVFEGAELTDCFRQNFDSYAEFHLPIELTDSFEPHDSMIRLVHNEDVSLGVTVPPRMVSEMRRIETESYGMTSFDLGLSIELVNDLESSFVAGALSSYVDGRPVLADGFPLVPGMSASLRLSDVSIDHLITENQTVVLYTYDEVGDASVD